jgi:phage/plasmid-like protein (TIGR03299 family)
LTNAYLICYPCTVNQIYYLGEKLSANIESFASFREPAWHNLGTVFQDEVTSSREMLQLAGLANWNVRLEGVELPAGYTTALPQAYNVVRTHPTNGNPDVLGVVGSRYKVYQNEEMYDFADALLDGARWETGGSLKDGTVVFGSLALERETVLDPNGVADVVKNYILVSSSHNGSTALQASITPTRVVCANTLAVALQGTKQSFKIRHTQSMDGKVVQAREALGLTHKYLDEFDKLAKAMIETEINDKVWYDIIKTAYPKPDTDAKGSFVKWDNKVSQLDSIYRGDTNFMIADTAWGAYNALTERLDYYRPARSGNEENVYASASGFDVATQNEKNRLLTVVKKLVAVA